MNRIRCPRHHQTDCSVLLNGCTWHGRLETACEVLHDAYEAFAADFGWQTQARSRVAWTEVPEENKATMRAAVATLLEHLGVDL